MLIVVITAEDNATFRILRRCSPYAFIGESAIYLKSTLLNRILVVTEIWRASRSAIFYVEPGVRKISTLLQRRSPLLLVPMVAHQCTSYIHSPRTLAAFYSSPNHASPIGEATSSVSQNLEVSDKHCQS